MEFHIILGLQNSTIIVIIITHTNNIIYKLIKSLKKQHTVKDKTRSKVNYEEGELAWQMVNVSGTSEVKIVWLV